jgi:ABC-type lipoprotein export system ATPase subunit
MGLIYQDYRLVEFLTVGENLKLAAECRGHRMSDREVATAMGAVGLEHIDPRRLPNSLSGGEQQRVAIARTMAARCEVVLADEPTGALDAVNTAQVTDLLLSTCDRAGVQLIIASHDHDVALRVPQLIDLGPGPSR